MYQIRRILYPTDFSSYSNIAWLQAVALAEQHGAALTILHVRPETDDSTEIACRQNLEAIRPLNPRISTRHILLTGTPGEEIVRFAEDAKIDLIVMGTHGRSTPERCLMGSVAEQVLREAPSSVLVVKVPRSVPRPDIVRRVLVESN